MKPTPWLALALSGTLLSAGDAPAAPAAPTVKWRGGLWASGAVSDRQTPDGSLFLNTVAAGEGALTLDGVQLGADVALAEGWALKVTLLGGRTAKVLNDADGETGSLAYPEAMLVWTGKEDILRLGRMYTFMGMEYLDHTQDVTASRGLLFTYAIPFNQVGLAWHHTFTPDWSTDVWVFNGEDRVRDNNRGKTFGLGLNYNHGGAADKFLSLMAYRGAEQDGLGAAAHSGAEGRKRERLCGMFGWAWGPTTLLGEVESAQETFAAGAIDPGETKAKWSAAGLILKHAFSDTWALFARAEWMKDDKGVRLNYDATVAADWGAKPDADLKAASLTLGVERKWGPTFSRLEVRRDSLNKDVHDVDAKAFRDGTSVTWSFGTSF